MPFSCLHAPRLTTQKWELFLRARGHHALGWTAICLLSVSFRCVIQVAAGNYVPSFPSHGTSTGSQGIGCLHLTVALTKFFLLRSITGPGSVVVDCEGLGVQFGITTELSSVILKGCSLLSACSCISLSASICACLTLQWSKTSSGSYSSKKIKSFSGTGFLVL